MRRIWVVLMVVGLLAGPGWAVEVDEIIANFEDSQNWVKSAMVSFKVQKKASDPKIADMFEFVADKSYDYEAMFINGELFGKNAGALADLTKVIGQNVLAVLHKITTDDKKTLFKPTWIGYQSKADRRVSNWFCLIMGDHVKTYLTRVDPKAKLDEIGADPLQLNLLDKKYYNFEIAKDLGTKVILNVTPKPEAQTNIVNGQIELAKLKVDSLSAWYVTRISGTMTNGTTGTTEFGGHRVAAAPVGGYVLYSDDGKLRGPVPVVSLAAATEMAANPEMKLYVFATSIKSVTQQKSKDVAEYEVQLQTNVKHLHINPTPEVMAQYIQKDRLETLIKVAKKVVASH